MTINLSELGSELIGWLKCMEEERDTTKLQQHIQAHCCKKSYENCETAASVLIDLSSVLRDEGFLEGLSELQVLIAKKVDELVKGPMAAAAPTEDKGITQKIDQKAPAVPSSDRAVNPEARRISLIKRELEEVAEELAEAERQVDDEEIRLLRRKHFGAYTADLNALLAKVEAAAKDVLPTTAPAEGTAPKQGDTAQEEAIVIHDDERKESHS